MDAPTADAARARSDLLTAEFPDDAGGSVDAKLDVRLAEAASVFMLLTGRAIGSAALGQAGPFGCTLEAVPVIFEPLALRALVTFAERATILGDSELIASSVTTGAENLASFAAGPYSESYFRPGEVVERRSLDADPEFAALLWAVATDCVRAAWERLWHPELAGLYGPATAFEQYDYFPEGATCLPSSWPYSSWPGPDGF